MAILKCKMCGGNLELVPDSTVCECEYCGSTQTVPKADDEKKMNLFQRANRLRMACDFDKAAGVYESIVAEFPEEAEAYWGLVLCKYGIEYVDDPGTYKKIPTCHRSSFDSVMDDSNLDQALENADAIARKVYREEAKAIETLRSAIVEISGKEDPYDIFICYKETDEDGQRTIDSVLAQDVYDALTDKGYRVFFSRITLEDKLGQEYEPYIFAALNSAKVMLAFGTDYEYFNAVWVKNEWSRYLHLMNQDKGKHLIPCYKGIDAYDMPREFAKIQAQDMGKVGAVQDLLRGIEKLIGRKDAESTKETPASPIVQQVIQSGGSNLTALLKRGMMALEDGDWSKASDFFDRVLDMDAECAEAYLGKFLVEFKAQNLESLKTSISASNYVPTATICIAGVSDAEAEDAIISENVVPGFLSEQKLKTTVSPFDFSYSCYAQNYKQEYDRIIGSKNLARLQRYASESTIRELSIIMDEVTSGYENAIKDATIMDQKNRESVIKHYRMHLECCRQKAAELNKNACEERDKTYSNLVRRYEQAWRPI